MNFQKFLGHEKWLLDINIVLQSNSSTSSVRIFNDLK